MKLRLVIRPATQAEELRRLKWLVGSISFFKEFGYDFKLLDLPKGELFEALYEKGGDLSDADQERLLNFVNADYCRALYAPGCSAFERARSKLEQAFLYFIEMNSLWSFKIFSSYHVAVSRYGMGANFHCDSGTVVAGFKSDGSVGRHRPEQLAVHEWVHMGVHEVLVLRHKLSHAEKERLVDLICSRFLSEIVGPDYICQEQGAVELDEYLDQISLAQISLAVESFAAKTKTGTE